MARSFIQGHIWWNDTTSWWTCIFAYTHVCRYKNTEWSGDQQLTSNLSRHCLVCVINALVWLRTRPYTTDPSQLYSLQFSNIDFCLFFIAFCSWFSISFEVRWKSGFWKAIFKAHSGYTFIKLMLNEFFSSTILAFKLMLN